MGERIGRSYLTDDGETIAITWDAIRAGKVPWEVLDDEEVSRGKLRDANNGWTGRGPDLLPRMLVQEQLRRVKERYDEKIRSRVLSLLDHHLAIAENEDASEADRLRAITYLTERVFGKIPDKLEMVAEVKPWEGLVEGVLQDVPVED